MTFSVDEFRQLIRTTLSESKERPSKNGVVQVLGTKGLDEGSITLECAIFIPNSEYLNIRDHTASNKLLLAPKRPPTKLNNGEYVQFDDFDEFMEEVSKPTSRSLREHLRLWSPHHSPYSYGVFPTMTKSQFSEFVLAWRSKGWSETGRWADGVHHHGHYDDDLNCPYCEARFSSIRGIGHPILASKTQQVHPRTKLAILSETNRGTPGFCCGDPVRPAMLYGSVERQMALRSGQAGAKARQLCSGCNRERTPLDNNACPTCGKMMTMSREEMFGAQGPGPKTLEWLQYENAAVAKWVRRKYKKDILEAIKKRLNIPPHALYQNYQNTLKRNPNNEELKRKIRTLKMMAKAVLGTPDSSGWPSNMKLRSARTTYTKVRNIAPPDLNNYLYRPPMGVDLKAESEYINKEGELAHRTDPLRVYNVSVDILLSGEARLKKEREELLFEQGLIPPADRAAKKASEEKLADLENRLEAHSLGISDPKAKETPPDLLTPGKTPTKLPKYQEGWGFFDFLTNHVKTLNVEECSELYKNPEGRTYRVGVIRTGIPGLNWIIDSFMPLKKKAIATNIKSEHPEWEADQVDAETDRRHTSMPHVEDENWNNFGRREIAFYDTLEGWFSYELGLNLAPWQQSSPFPIDNVGNIYVLFDNTYIKLDIDGTVNWKGLLDKVAPQLTKNQIKDLDREEFAWKNELEQHKAEHEDDPWVQNVRGRPDKEEQKREGDSYLKRFSDRKTSPKAPATPIDRTLPIWMQNIKKTKKPTRPELIGQVVSQSEDEGGLVINVVRNGCGVMKALRTTAFQIIKSKERVKEAGESFDLESLLTEFAPELVRLAQDCSGGKDFMSILGKLMEPKQQAHTLTNKEFEKFRNLPHTRPHTHTVDRQYVAWEDSVGEDESIKTDLEAGSYRVDTLIRNDDIHRVTDGGGSKEWYILNISRIRDAKFRPPEQTGKRKHWPGPWRRRSHKAGDDTKGTLPCDVCKGTGTAGSRSGQPGAPSDLEPCSKCEGTKDMYIFGIDYVSKLLQEYNSAIGAPINPKLAKGMAAKFKKLEAKSDEWWVKRTEPLFRLKGDKTQDQRATAILAQQKLRDHFASLVQIYDRGIALPRGNKVMERLVPYYNKEKGTLDTHPIKVPATVLIPSKAEFLPDGSVSYKLDRKDRLAMHYNWWGEEGIPSMPVKSPLEDRSSAIRADYWENLMRNLRSQSYWSVLGSDNYDGDQTSYYLDQHALEGDNEDSKPRPKGPISDVDLNTVDADSNKEDPNAEEIGGLSDPDDEAPKQSTLSQTPDDFENELDDALDDWEEVSADTTEKVSGKIGTKQYHQVIFGLKNYYMWEWKPDFVQSTISKGKRFGPIISPEEAREMLPSINDGDFKNAQARATEDLYELSEEFGEEQEEQDEYMDEEDGPSDDEADAWASYYDSED